MQMVLRFGPGQHTYDCVVILQAILVGRIPLVGIYFGIACSIMQLLQRIENGLMRIDSLDYHSVVPGST